MALFFLAMGFIYICSAFVFKKTKSTRSRLVLERKKEFTPLISAFLFFNPESPAADYEAYIAMKIKIRQMLKDSLNRKVLTEILLDLGKDLSGDAQQQVFSLYQDLELHKDAFKKLRSWRWELVSKGIEELTEMSVVRAYPFIKKFINDRRSVIRKQAQLATVTLHPEGIGYFLDTAQYRISEWQQMSLLDILQHKENFEPPKFKAWLISKNRDVVHFTLRLIKYYNQNDAREELIQLVRHPSNRVKLEAIECIDKFHVYESLEILKAVFKKGNTDVKIAILNAIAHMGSEADLEFLKRTAEKDPNFIIRTKAEGSINAISPGSISPSDDVEDISPEVANPRQAAEAKYAESLVENGKQTEFDHNPAEFQKKAAIREAEDQTMVDLHLLDEVQDCLTGMNESLPREEEAERVPDFNPHVLNEGEEKLNPYVSEAPAKDLVAKAQHVLPDPEKIRPENTGITESDPDISEIDWDNRRLDFEAFLESGSIWDDNPQAVGIEKEPETSREVHEDYPAEDDEIIEIIRDKGPELDIPGTSIFVRLFDKTDRDGKLILLEEIRRIGELKECHFLKTLREEDPQLLRVARKVIAELEQRYLDAKKPERRLQDTIGDSTGSSLNRMEGFDFKPDFHNEAQLESVMDDLPRHPKMAAPILKILAIWRQLIHRI